MSEPIPIPPLFLERMSRFLGDEFPAFAESQTRAPVHGLRVNTLKLSTDEFRKVSPFPLGDGVPWCHSAFTLTPAPLPAGNGQGVREPGKHPYHLAGLYYLQDPSAMSAAELLGPRPGERVLDLAAAPGGKTTHIASLMQGQGLLVANEIKTKRLNHLVVNVERWGADNVVVTNETPERVADHFGAFFDRVLVDAPCSGEGMFRKDMGARLDWSEEMVAGCAVRQTNILRVAAHLVRPGGHLLYSTCTFAPEEDEAVVARFLHEHPDFEVEVLPQMPGFMPGHPEWLSSIAEINIKDTAANDSLRGAVRLFPHRLTGEGHFACLLQRKDGPADELTFPWRSAKIPTPEWQAWQAFREETLGVDFPSERLRMQGDRLYFVPEDMPDLKGLCVTIPGIWLGNFKKERFEPAHSLAAYLRPGEAHKVLALSADSREMAAYLRGESLPAEGAPGWTLVTVDGWPLGWGKHVQGVVKNHFPKGWQIYS
ncbi:MAG TPA: RsmB/NOP family class I SAM-dependent RNA methyltransferase [Anaerolineales bacterium]